MEWTRGGLKIEVIEERRCHDNDGETDQSGMSRRTGVEFTLKECFRRSPEGPDSSGGED